MLGQPRRRQSSLFDLLLLARYDLVHLVQPDHDARVFDGDRGE